MTILKPLCFYVFVGFFSVSSGGENRFHFTLPDLDGKTHSLEDYRGKIVILDFWAVWCVACRSVFPLLNEIKTSFPAEKVAVLGISIDKKPLEYVKKFSKTAGIRYTVLHDPRGITPDQFRIQAVPSLFIFRADGSLAGQESHLTEKNRGRLVNLIKNLVSEADQKAQAQLKKASLTSGKQKMEEKAEPAIQTPVAGREERDTLIEVESPTSDLEPEANKNKTKTDSLHNHRPQFKEIEQ